jgi:hypothetical protein
VRHDASRPWTPDDEPARAPVGRGAPPCAGPRPLRPRSPAPAAPARSPWPGLRTEVAMQDPLDPAAMTPEERTREVAALLATG